MKIGLFALATAFAFGAAVPASAQFFPKKTLFGIQTQFYATQAADLNVDGFPDLVATRNTDRRAVYWYWNDGEGHFPAQPSDSLEIGFEIYQVTVADLNGDGFPDLAAFHYNFNDPGPVTWFAGDGQGHFAEQAAQYDDGIPVNDLFVADMDGDGDQDLILAEDAIFAINLRWAANDGQGNFSNQQPIATFDPYAPPVYITDINADGLPDVLVWDIHTWYLNTGAGGFEAHNYFTNGGTLIGIADADGDADLDLFAYNFTGKIALIRNTETPVPGSFVTEDVPVPGDSQMSLGDYDGDGDPDLMVVNSGQWLKNDGSGQFALQDSFSYNLLPGPSNFSLAPTVDFDGDGREETLLSGYGWAARVGVTEEGKAFSDLIVPEVIGAARLKAFDYDGDGDQDIVAASDKLYWFSNQGSGQFGHRQDVVGLSFNPTSIEFADLDGDTDRDILLGHPYDPFNNSYSYWLRNLGGGAYALPVELSMPNPQLFDLDGDGDQDILGSAPLQFSENDGNGNFGAPQNLASCLGIPAASDMDGDGNFDLAVPCGQGISIFKNGGAANFSLVQELTPASEYSRCRWADLDQSGRPDVLVVTDSGIVWFPQQADGSFAALHTIYQPGYSAIFNDRVLLSDVDGDGDLDIVVSLITDQILILGNDGTGAFTTVFQFSTVDYLSSLIPLDVSGDGAPDLLFSTSYTIGWFENAGRRAFLGGVCFWDKNENKQRDPGEPPVRNQALQISPAGKLTFTGPDGSFRAYADSGQVALSVQLDSCWVLTTDSAVYHRSFDGENTINGLDFGLQITGTEKKLAAYLAAGPTRCNAQVGVLVSVQNEACVPVPAVFDLLLDSLSSFLSAVPPPDFVAPGLLRWHSADTLLPGAAFDIALRLKVAGPEHLGDTLRLTGLVRSLDAAGNPEPQADSVFLNSVVNCAYDPNDKLVSRATLPEDYDAAASELLYTVRFQNTGNNVAFNVTLRDPLAPELDWKTFRPLSATHPYSVELDSATRTARFFFENIQLPDSAANEPGSHGLLQFAIRPLAGLSPGTVISNQAGIYFDFNAPVLTNTAETKIHSPLLATTPVRVWQVSIQPNPNDGNFALVLPEAAMPGTWWRMIGLTGQVLLENQIEPGSARETVQAGELPPGLYFLQVISQGRVVAVEKFVKQ